MRGPAAKRPPGSELAKGLNRVPLATCITLTVLFGPTADADLRVHESRYYIIRTDLSPQRAADIGHLMDATGKEYAERFRGFRGVVRRKPTVKVYATREAYLAAVARACGEPNVNARGIHCTADDMVYTYDGDHLDATLKHECFHQFAHFVVGGALPPWLNEGLAEYFEEGVFDEKTSRLTLGATPAWRVALLRAARGKQALFPIDRLMSLARTEWNDNMQDDRGVVQYSEAWLLCHFLIHAEQGKFRPHFETFLRHLDQGLDGDTAFKRVFGNDTAVLEERLGEYLAGLRPTDADAKDGNRQ